MPGGILAVWECILTLAVYLTMFLFEFWLWTFTINLSSSVKMPTRLDVKGALQRYSVFLCRFFCGWKWQREDPGCGAGEWVACDGHDFSFFFFECGALKMIGVRVSVSCPCKAVPLSHNIGLWELFEKVRTKLRCCQQWSTWTMEKIHEIQTRSAELWINLDLSCAHVRSSSANLSGKRCVNFATQYNVLYDMRQTGHLLRALRLEMHDRHYFFHNKMAQKVNE